jgi:hypothetical protein
LTAAFSSVILLAAPLLLQERVIQGNQSLREKLTEVTSP